MKPKTIVVNDNIMLVKGDIMSYRKILIPALCMAVLATGAVSVWAQAGVAAKAKPTSQATASLNKRALDALKLMSDTLSKAKTVRFQARSMVPAKTPSGVWINLYGTSQVVMQGPDKLFANTAGDFAPYDFYFDGKTITRYSPDKNLYSVKESPGTIDDMIERAYAEEGKSFPYADILVSEPYAVMTDGLISAYYIGQSTIKPLSGSGSVKADHLVFSNKGVEWQIWIATVDHLPLLVCATYLDEASEPSYTVEFGDWKIDEPVNADAFIFKNVSNAAKVEFRNPRDTAGKKVVKGGRP
jgi:hypothetical protein